MVIQNARHTLRICFKELPHAFSVKMPSSLTPDQIEKYGSRLLGQKLWPVLPHHWQQNRAFRKLVQDGSSAATRAMALAVVCQSLDDEVMRQNLITALKFMREAQQLQEIAEIAWQFSSDKWSEHLLSLIKKADYLPSEPVVIRVAIALACGWPERLANDGPKVVTELLAAWKEALNCESAEVALLGLREISSRDALCKEWFNSQSKFPELLGLVKQLHHLPRENPRLRVAVALACGWPERLANDGPEVVPELLAACQHGSISDSAEIALRSLRAVSSLDALCVEWFNTGWDNHKLLYFIKQIDHLPRRDPRLRVAVALVCGWPERLANDGAEVGQALHDAWENSWFPDAAVAAIRALRAPGAIDALCRRWMETGTSGDDLALLLISAGHAPSDPADRALFWMLSGQLQAYDLQDGDGFLLAQAQAAASAPVRQRVAEASAAAGRTEWLQVVQQSKPLEDFSAEDWAAAVQVVARTGDAQTIWRWALQSPPLHSRTLLRAIPAGTAPPPHLGELARVLQALAQDLPAPREWSAVRLDPCTQVLEGHGDELYEIAWSPDGRGLASASADGTIRLWNPASGACNHILMGHARKFHSGRRNAMAWSPDGKGLASAGHDGTICLWDTASGESSQIHQGMSHSNDPHFVYFNKVNQIAWSPDGSCVAANVADRAILVWDPISCICTPTPDRKGDFLGAMQLGAMQWSPRGQVLAYVTGMGIRVWDPHTSTRAPILKGHTRQVPSLCWSPDGSRLASCSLDYTIRLWDAQSGTCTRMLLTEGTYAHTMEAPLIAAWSPDGRCLASASELGTIRLWDTASGACTHTLKDLKGYNRSVAWSPNGRYLASRGGGKTIQLWNPISGTCAHTLEGHGGYVQGMAWSPDGTCLASASSDGTVRLWRYPLEFKDVLMTPLLCFDDQLWHFVSVFKTNTLPTAEWEWISPWLTFLTALGTLLRRFDVGVDTATAPLQGSSFEIEIAG